MRHLARWIPLVLALLGGGCAASGPRFPAAGEGEWVDLTHAFDGRTLVWPTSEPFVLETLTRGHTDKGYFYAANRMSLAEHGGTHMDAPIHFHEGRRSVDEVPVQQLVGPACVVRVAQAAQADRDYRVSVADIQAWEAAHGPLPAGAIVLLDTGSARRWPDAKAYMGTDERGAGAVAKLHFPGLHPDAARWLAQERRIGAVGIDTPSIDYGQSTRFEAHVALAAANVAIFENVAGLDRLPPAGAHVVALPMKVGAGTGAPLRIAAWLPPR